jgi:hypothetical protein
MPAISPLALCPRVGHVHPRGVSTKWKFVARQGPQNGDFRRRATTFFRPMDGRWTAPNTDDHDLFTPVALPLHYCDFSGRLSGALGVSYRHFNVPILAPNAPDAVRIALYEYYEYYESIWDLTIKAAPMPVLSIPFALAKTDLTSEHREAIDIFLKQWHQGLHITIEGYACTAPVITPESLKAYGNNQGFSEARAHAVRQFLDDRGIPAENIRSSVGRGESTKGRCVDITFVQATA